MSLVMSEVFILVFWHTTTMDDGICCLVRVSAVHNALWDTLSALYRAVNLNPAIVRPESQSGFLYS